MTNEKMSFIERQFPVSKISKESYKERKANNAQTLTGLGKWWGRKPLILVRATILGSLMAASENPKKDMDIFLKILSMDNDGLVDRKTKSMTIIEMYDYASESKHFKQYLNDWFIIDKNGKVKLQDGIDRKELELRIFKTLGYDAKLLYTCRPEQLNNLRQDSWNAINQHLGTHANTLQELIQELSVIRYGKNIVVGDCFCGGGSIPFEASRMGADSYASDLNPVASLLTWAGINVCGASEDIFKSISKFQKQVFEDVDNYITQLGIEHNENGDRAMSYLYCIETTCPECGKHVPLAPNWVIGKGTKTVAQLVQNGNGYDLIIKMNANAKELSDAENTATICSKGFICPSCGKITPINILRKDKKDKNGQTVYGLRQWEKNEFDFRETDVFNERLYAIKYEDKNGKRYYRHPNKRDIENELKVKQIVAANIIKWQEDGTIPEMKIENGYNTSQVIRERGWAYWHQLFNARQLLTLEKIIERVFQEENRLLKTIGLLGIHKCIDINSKICVWHNGGHVENSQNTFLNQALNTLFNYGCRSLCNIGNGWFFNINGYNTNKNSKIKLCDARVVQDVCHYWITDPPYADAVNYHELSEFFLAWDKRLIKDIFPEWYTDSKRILAVRGDSHFSQTMIEIYSNLTSHMQDDGMQVVMFTHSDPAVWAQLAIIMWKSGLKVTAAWNIATETESGGLKDGNYVKGTVLLILRKQQGVNKVYLDEINSDIKSEVKLQIASMLALETKEESNFSDPDFVLAAYAASLKVLTSYKEIEDLDLDYELSLAITDPSKSKIVSIIERAKKIAYDCIIPVDFENYLWKDLTNGERFYIKGLESEKHGVYQISTYQEYSRGFGLNNYSQLMANEKANAARLKTPSEMANRTIGDIADFEKSVLRVVCEGIYVGIKEDDDPTKALGYIKNELFSYWDKRDMIKQLLSFIIDVKNITNMQLHWSSDVAMAEQLYSLVLNDGV